MGVDESVKGNIGRRNPTDIDNSIGQRSGGSNHGGSNRTTTQAPSHSGGNRPGTPINPRQVERLRAAVDGTDPRKNWGDWFVIGGATILGLCVIATLILASAINARANRIITADIVRDKESIARNARVDAFIKRLDDALAEHYRQATEHANATETKVVADANTSTSLFASATTLPKRHSTPTPRRSTPTPTSTVPRTTTTLAPLPPSPPPVAPVIPPCRITLLGICVVA